MNIAVTGANAGIGKAISAELARRGHRVLMVCRSPDRGEAARADLERTGLCGLEVLPGDLGSLAGIEAAARTLQDAAKRLDGLVHNAGIWPTRCELNADGLEQSFVTNHLAPFLLNHRLEPVLRAARGRVVLVTAGLAVKGRVDLERTPTGADFGAFHTYPTTKLCALMCVPRFAARWRPLGITVNAVHPGVIRTGLGAVRGPLGWMLALAKRFWGTPEQGADGPVHLATAPELAGVTGVYYDRRTPIAYPAAVADEALVDRIWQQAAAFCGLTATRRAEDHGQAVTGPRNH